MPNDSAWAAAYAINASGAITGGGSSIAGFVRSAGGTVTALPPLVAYGLVTGYAINTSGEVVGSAQAVSMQSATHAIYYNGVTVDLNTVIAQSDPLKPYVTLTDARGINDNGLVVVNGVDSRDKLSHAYLLQVPLITMVPGQLTFASQVVGMASAPQTMTLTNVGATVLALGAISTTGNFAQTNNCGLSLAPSGGCKVTVTFEPSFLGTNTGALTVVADGTPLAVPLSGAGAMPPTSPPSGGGGGGSIDPWTLLGLAGFVLLRRRITR
jgi:hypothetical protein